MDFDAIVVGGGPSGSTAAWWLATFGRRVLLIDKATFPREKVCGDGLTPRAVRCLNEMGVDTTGPSWSRAKGLRIIGAGVKLELPWPSLSVFPDYGLVRTRLDFDSMLLDHARKAGAVVWESAAAAAALTDGRGVVTGVRVERLDPSSRRRAVLSVEDVHAPVVIACDGASSHFGAKLGGRRIERRPMGVAVRTYYRSSRSEDDYLESYLELWRGNDLLPGYGWIFPLPDGTVNVGLGLLNTSPHFQNVDYKKLLAEWVAGLGLAREDQIGGVRGGPLPMGANRAPIAKPGFLVAGDAAGLVNPFNGEGIAYAMETGRIAAEVALDALVTGDPWALRAYPERVRERYEGYFILGRAFVRLIGDARVMGALTKHGLPNERLMRFAFRILANLTEPRGGGKADLIINALVRAAPTLNVVVGA